MEKQPPSTLLKKYREGRCTPQEEIVVVNWLTDPQNQELVEGGIANEFDEAKPVQDIQLENRTLKQQMWTAIHQQMDGNSTIVHYRPTNYFRRRNLVRIAAILIPLLLVIGIARNELHEPKSEQTTNVGIQQYITKSTKRGEKLTLGLPDGSKVYLRAASSILIPDNYLQLEERSIILEKGEAFFEVTKNGKPFKVLVDNQEVAVLGTSFSVKKGVANNNVHVTVRSGKVKVSEKGQYSEILKKGDGLKVLESGVNRFVIEDLETAFAWKDGILIFEGASFEEVVEELGQWYGVYFSIPVDYKHRENKFKGRYENESLETVLEGFAHVSGFAYRIEGDTVYLNH